MQNLRSVLLNQESKNNLPHHIGCGYINVPSLIGDTLTYYLESNENDAHSLFDSLENDIIYEYVVKEAYHDEYLPPIVEELFIKHVPFLYQYDLDDDYVTTIGYIPGFNNSELFFISGKDNILQSPKARILEKPINKEKFNNHLSKLLARFALINDLDLLPENWMEQ